MEVLHSKCQQIWKTQPWPQDWKSQFSFQSQRRATKKYSNYHTIALILHANKIKIPPARLQQYVNGEPPDVQTGFRKGRGTRD